MSLAEREMPEFAVVDLRLGGQSGLDVVRALHAIDAETKIVVLTGYGSIATAMEAVRLGATGYLSKPADADDILSAFTRGEAASPRLRQPLTMRLRHSRARNGSTSIASSPTVTATFPRLRGV